MLFCGNTVDPYWYWLNHIYRKPSFDRYSNIHIHCHSTPGSFWLHNVLHKIRSKPQETTSPSSHKLKHIQALALPLRCYLLERSICWPYKHTACDRTIHVYAVYSTGHEYCWKIQQHYVVRPLTFTYRCLQFQGEPEMHVCVCMCVRFFFSSLCYLFISRFMQLCIWMWAAWAVGIGHLFLHNRLSPLYMICDYVRPVLSVSSFILVRRLGALFNSFVYRKVFFLGQTMSFSHWGHIHLFLMVRF